MQGNDRRQRHHAQELHKLLPQLIDARRRASAHRERLEAYRRDHRPEVPSSFDVDGLAAYTADRERYEAEEKRLSGELSAAEKELRSNGKTILGLLPEGVPLTYEYAVYMTGTPFGTYEVRKVSSEDGPSLEIQEVQDKE